MTPRRTMPERMTQDGEIPLIHSARPLIVLAAMLAVVAVLGWRLLDLQVLERDFLQSQGDARHLRVMQIAAHRGMITDRHGQPLAISTPVDSVWANPGEVLEAPLDAERWRRLAQLLGTEVDALQGRILARKGREFVYLKRHLDPDRARRVMALGIPGIYLQREYRRFYPAAEVTAHVVGFTDVDDRGQEGIELAYDDWLRGRPGRKRVLKDRLGHVVEDVERLQEAVPGRDLRLSLDLRLQYLAYRELMTAVRVHGARGGSVVVLDARSGEILAMVNQPAYNPNNRQRLRSEHVRNRAVTDVFEPGSTVKPFTVAAALETGRFRPDSRIDTRPGRLRVGHNTIRDETDHGLIDVTTVIQKSSNVGASKIALALEAEQLWRVFTQVGFGALPGSSFPGEVSGLLTDYWRWHEIERATLAFGYGLSVTTLQLAQAYAVLADGGLRRPASFLALEEIPAGEPVLRPATARQVVTMMETVVGTGGTGRLAAVRGYRVAGKTGTVQKAGPGGYAEERYVALFAGMAPASEPRLVVVVMIDEPQGEVYYGGQVAAPVFARIMTDALRLLGIPPDGVGGGRQHMAAVMEVP